MNNSSRKEAEITKKSSQSRPKKLIFKTKINWWKVATLTMIGFFIGGGIYLFSLMSSDREADFTPTPTEITGDATELLTMETNKEKVNTLIDHYLDEYLSSDKIKYEFYLENQALLKGTFELLGYPLAFYLYFEPYVMENGNVQLKARSVSIGALGIPMKEVLRYISKNLDFPKWITFNLNEETIIVHLDEFDLVSGLKIHAEKINLIDDEIKFSLYLDQTKGSDKND